MTDLLVLYTILLHHDLKNRHCLPNRRFPYYPKNLFLHIHDLRGHHLNELVHELSLYMNEGPIKAFYLHYHLINQY